MYHSGSTFDRACQVVALTILTACLTYSVVFRQGPWARRWRGCSVQMGADTGGGVDADSGSAGSAQHVDRGSDPKVDWWSE